MNSFIKSDTPSQQPETRIANHDAFAQRVENQCFCKINPMEMIWRGTGRLSAIALTFDIDEPGVLPNTVLAKVPEAAWNRI